MKILILASRPLEHSGITKIEMDVIDYIDESADIIIACPFGFENEYGKILMEKNIRCIDLPSKRKVLKYMKEVYRLIRREGINKVYIHGNSAMMIFEAFPSSIAGASVVTHCHNTKTDYPIINYLAKPLFNIVVDEKIGVSKMASKWAYSGKKIITIPNGVDLKRFCVDMNVRDRIRRELKCEYNHIYGHIGAFNKQKNHVRLISIFREILEIDKDAVLLLIGDGDLKLSIQDFAKKLSIEDKVIFLEFTHNPEDYYQAMDVMIMPSLHEGLCLAALEAQACSVPVLVSDVFAEETFVTDKCQSLSLNEGDVVWANKAISMIDTERIDTSDQFLEKGMDYETMMRKIANILLQ